MYILLYNNLDYVAGDWIELLLILPSAFIPEITVDYQTLGLHFSRQILQCLHKLWPSLVIKRTFGLVREAKFQISLHE